MPPHSLWPVLVLSVSALVKAQALEPLTDRHFTWPNIPYQVAGDQAGPRGPQFGFNQCNSTTENQGSLCQTLFLNSLADFCMWSSSQENDTIGEGEAREVAWCVKPGHGTRVIPPGAITGAQFLYAKNYVQVVGYIDQTKVGLQASDLGGELDPHGADEQGNPLGGIVFSNGFTSNAKDFQSQIGAHNFDGTGNPVQVIEWINFMGSGMFCLKMCNPTFAGAPALCNHIYDVVGCQFNAAANYAAINGTFEACDSEDMTPPGVYTVNGQVSTWVQGASPVIPPYTPTIPASSNCVQYKSQDLFASAASESIFSTSSATHTTTSTPAKATGTGQGSGSRSGGSGPAPTGSSNASPAAGGIAMPFVTISLVTLLMTIGVMIS